MIYMLDTCICSFLIRGPSDSLASKIYAASQSHHALVISSITYHELLNGCVGKKAPARLRSLISELVQRLDAVLAFDDVATRTAFECDLILSEQGQRIGRFDTLIAGHALALNAVLITNNMREFQRVPGLLCEDWH